MIKQPEQQFVLTRSTRRRSIWIWGSLVLGWFVFYWLSAPAVHVEADDAYLYADQVEAAPFAELVHPYHPLYLPLMRALFLVGESIGRVERSFELMILVGAAMSAAAVVLFSLLLWKRIGVQKWPAIVTGGLLGFSYGFWRYAAEVEVYALAFLSVLGLVWWTFERQSSLWRTAIGGLFGLLAVLGHLINLIPAVVSIPLYLALRNGKKHAVVYLAVFGLAFLPSAAAIWSMARVEYPQYANTHLATGEEAAGLDQKEIFATTAVLGHVVANGNFLFVFPEYRAWVSERFPGQRLEGEKLVGARAWPLTGTVGSITLIIAVIAFGWTVYRGVRVLPALSDPVVLATLSWLGLYLGAMAYTGNLEQPESWLLALVPFWVLFARLVYVGLQFRGNALLLLFLPGALLLHNSIGGMAMLKNPESDRHRLKARWLLENAGEKDVILTSESAGFTRYLVYYSDAEVVSLQQLSASEVEKIQEESMRSADRVFLTGEVVHPPSWMQRSAEPWMSESGSALERFRDATRQVHQDDWGGVFLLKAPADSVAQ